MKRTLIVIAALLLSASASAQVQPGCQEVPGQGMMCTSPFTFQKGIEISPVVTVATLGPCNAGLAGTLRTVSDATAPTYNGALTGGGGVTVPVFCNGAAWLSH